MNTLYGIKNCDTMKKARTWLDEHGVSYVFHDYKVAGIDHEHLEKWCKQLGWEVVLNRAGTTFKKLPEADKVNLPKPRPSS
jgi:Spx/MgsR family transcriptional regulator